MSTSMPAIKAITVTTEQVSYLRHLGPGSLLVWIEACGQVQVYPPTGRLGQHRMIIATHQSLGELAEQRDEDGSPCDEEALAADLTDIANDWLSDWAQVRAMTPMLTPIRLRLDGHGIYPAGPVTVRCQGTFLPAITESFARPGGQGHVRVSIPLGYAEPVRISTAAGEHTIQFDYLHTWAESIEALIAATVTCHLDLYQA